MSSSALCIQAWDASVRLYTYGVIGNIAFTIFCFAVHSGLRQALAGSPGLSAQFYMVIGSFKMAMGLVLLLLLIPQCPDECYACDGEISYYYVYPSGAMFLGLLWICKGLKGRKHASDVLGDEDKDDIVFDSISTVEMS